MPVIKRKTKKAITKQVRKIVKKHGPEVALGLATALVSSVVTEATGGQKKKAGKGRKKSKAKTKSKAGDGTGAKVGGKGKRKARGTGKKKSSSTKPAAPTNEDVVADS